MAQQANSRPRYEPPSDPLILAALARADRHRPPMATSVHLTRLAGHLGLPWHPMTARRLRPLLQRLIEAGDVEMIRRHGVTGWNLTVTGRRHLAASKRTGKRGELPESPQHRRWRAARVVAMRRIEAFRRDVTELLRRGDELLASEKPMHSDEWFLLADDLRRACWRLGSATHCLHEWPEPDDRKRDADPVREPGDRHLSRRQRERRRWLRHTRRNVTLWND